MLQHRPRIAAGDLVIVHEDYANHHAVRIEPGGKFKGYWGTFAHDAMIGKRFGDKMHSGGARGGYVYLLPPSAELWTASLPHRTQILYIADISSICLQLELLPGSVCVEAGTGSGSLSHALARSVGPTGKLHTYEFNAHRASLAKAEFAANGLDDRVISRHGDVCADGWVYEGIADGSVDAAIFDLPQPWDAVRLASRIMRPGGRLCTFSPCIEQVGRTLDVLASCGFTGAEVIEVLTRTHEVRAGSTHHESIAKVVAQAEAAQAEAEAAAAATAQAAAPEAEAAAEALELAVAAEAPTAVAPPAAAGEETSAGAKRRRVGTEDGGEGGAAADGAAAKAGGNANGGAASGGDAAKASEARRPPQLSTKPYADMRGHTGFLMFCTKHVDFVHAEPAEAVAETAEAEAEAEPSAAEPAAPAAE